MPLYECVLIARNDVTQQQVEAVADAVATQLETDGGTIQKREYWGLRSLSYRIKKNRKGHYMLLGLDAPPASVREIERQLGLNEDVLRFMTIRVDEIDENPSAIRGRKRGYDDREEFRARDLNDPIDE
jgi:small subunit ribosomal protein S6